MGRNRRADDAYCGHADLIGVFLHAELMDGRKTLVERALVPESFFRTTDAAMAGLDRERNAAVPAHRRAGVVGRRSLAAHLVEAIALARRLVVPFLDELARVEMRAAVAFVVDALRIKHLRPTLTIKLGQLPEGRDVSHDAGHDFRDRRAARHLDDGL